MITIPMEMSISDGSIDMDVEAGPVALDMGLEAEYRVTGGVLDVLVDGTSVVDEDGVASVDLTGKSDTGHKHTVSDINDFPDIPEKVSDLQNDAGYLTAETDPTVPQWAKAQNKPTYTATEVGALPDDTPIPSKVSDLQNDSGFLIAETDPTVPSWAKQSSKPTYTAQEVGALPADTPIPSKVSDLQNDSGFLSSETDPTVPSWAKAAQKPTYTAQEVGALPDDTPIPSKTSDLTNDSGFITESIYYGTCASAAADTTKVVTCAAFTNAALKAGAAILVQFSATNSAAVADLKLNVNNTGAKAIKYNNNGTLGNLVSAGYLKASTIYLFIYDGTYWVAYFNYNTTYSAMTDAEYQGGTSTTARLITAAKLKAAILLHETGEPNVQADWSEADSTSDAYIQNKPSIPTVPSNVSAFNNDAGYLTLATLPVYNGGVS